MIRKIFLSGVAVVSLLIGAVITAVGPWPAYGPGDFKASAEYQAAVHAIETNARETKVTGAPGPFSAGWAEKVITPKLGTPLAGYGDRRGRPSTGVHDDIYVKALAVSDGVDIAVIVGSDMLIVPDNVADLARARAAAQTPLTANNILFNASHTHSGPGAWGSGFAAESFAGRYDPEIVTFLADAFASAIVAAYDDLKPARVAVDAVDAPAYIRNRSRDAGVDPHLGFIVVERENGKRCYIVRYSAHPTVLGGGNMEFSGDFPGALMRRITAVSKADAIYLGGAVGSMGPKAPDAPDAFARAEAMGVALADEILAAADSLSFETHVDVASVGISFLTAPLQLRFTPSWRFSPVFVKWLGVDREGWMGGVRIGQTVLIGAPCDFSGELSAQLRAWGKERGLDLWPLSFSGDYLGYISPDEYYAHLRDAKGNLAYETGLMSWCGPNQGAYFSSLMQEIAGALTRE